MVHGIEYKVGRLLCEQGYTTEQSISSRSPKKMISSAVVVVVECRPRRKNREYPNPSKLKREWEKIDKRGEGLMLKV